MSAANGHPGSNGHAGPTAVLDEEEGLAGGGHTAKQGMYLPGRLPGWMYNRKRVTGVVVIAFAAVLFFLFVALGGGGDEAAAGDGEPTSVGSHVDEHGTPLPPGTKLLEYEMNRADRARNKPPPAATPGADTTTSPPDVGDPHEEPHVIDDYNNPAERSPPSAPPREEKAKETKKQETPPPEEQIPEEKDVKQPQQEQHQEETTHTNNQQDLDKLLHPEKYFKEFAALRTRVDRMTLLCKSKYDRMFAPGSATAKIREAECGRDSIYAHHQQNATRGPWNVVLLGRWDEDMLRLSGCLQMVKCPYFPKCKIYHTPSRLDLEQDVNARVVVVNQLDYKLFLSNYVPRPNVYRALYYREALWNEVAPHEQVQFDFIMGIHTQSGILNPDWLVAPSALLAGVPLPSPALPIEERPNFAFSAISDCNAPSLRSVYLTQLGASLGGDRVHYYGACGDRQLPPRPITNALKLIVSYKFYMSFENTIQDIYVTEKLYWALAFPIIPVFYGTTNAPNITRTPSYIHAKDFPNPRALAQYLLHLDANPQEMHAYGAWRSDPASISEEYLEFFHRVSPGPAEYKYWMDAHHSAADKDQDKDKEGPDTYTQPNKRKASCCRLCDPDIVGEAVRRKVRLVSRKMRETEIMQTFFKAGGG